LRDAHPFALERSDDDALFALLSTIERDDAAV
jgi:hypothetical protein